MLTYFDLSLKHERDVCITVLTLCNINFQRFKCYQILIMSNIPIVIIFFLFSAASSSQQLLATNKQQSQQPNVSVLYKAF